MLSKLPQSTTQDLPIFLDHQATTPCAKEVIAAMAPYWNEKWGNSSSRQHREGLKAAAAVSMAREELASHLRVAPEQIIFTSGATEANNIALIGHARAMSEIHGKPGHLITLSTEHRAVLDPIKQLEKEGFQVTEITPQKDGILDLNQLVEVFKENTFLVSIMIANNEIGVIQPIKEIAQLCKERNILLHSDAAQALGHISLYPEFLGIDFTSVSAHKMYGPKGIGALIMRPEIPVQPLQWGGSQEKGIRPGTLAVPLIIGLAKAAEIAIRDLKDYELLVTKMRNKFLEELKSKISGISLNGSQDERLPHNLNITIAGVQGSILHKELRPFISCSSGSACANGAPSHVLMALGLNAQEAKASLRLSLSRYTTEAELKNAAIKIKDVINKLRSQN